MEEDKFEVWCQTDGNTLEKIASDMIMSTALILMRAYMEEYWANTHFSLILKRMAREKQ